MSLRDQLVYKPRPLPRDNVYPQYRYDLQFLRRDRDLYNDPVQNVKLIDTYGPRSQIGPVKSYTNKSKTAIYRKFEEPEDLEYYRHMYPPNYYEMWQ